MRGDCSELSHDKLDVCIISQLSACVRDSSETAHSTLRKFSYAGLRHHGKRVCMKTFMFMHGIGGWRMRALKSTMLERGIVQRVHGNTKWLPHNTLSFEGTQRVVAFVTSTPKSMPSCCLVASPATSVQTYSFFRPTRQRRMCGGSTVLQAMGMGCRTALSVGSGIGCFRTSSSPSLWQTFAGSARRMPRR